MNTTTELRSEWVESKDEAEIEAPPSCCVEKNDAGQVRVRWRCPVCEESIRFHPHDIEVMDFFAVHHLVRKHEIDAAQASAYAMDLKEVVAECGAALSDNLASKSRRTCQSPSEMR